jgi:RNA methyltransferase, TrmH family
MTMALTRARRQRMRSLAQKKGRAVTGTFLVEGLRLIQEAAVSDFVIEEVYHTQEFMDEPAGRALIDRLRRKTSQICMVTKRELESITDTVTAQGIVAVVRPRVFSVDDLLRPEDVPSVLVALDSVSDPGNLGSMVRTCDWFGVQGILLGRASVELHNPKVVRATMGGLFHLPIVEDVDLLSTISRARQTGYRVYVTDASGETHFDRVRFATKSIIIFGNEAWGVSDQLKRLADVRIAIRRYGAAESLNVGVACGIVLSSLHRLMDEELP